MAICIMPLTLKKRTGWQYASCPSLWRSGQKKEKREKKRNEKNTDGKSVGGGKCLCHGAAGR